MMVVSCTVRYDKDIGEGHRHEKDSLSNYFIDPISTVGAYDVKLEGRKVQKDDLFEVPSVVCTNQRISCILGLCYWLSDCFKKNHEVYSSDAFIYCIICLKKPASSKVFADFLLVATIQKHIFWSWTTDASQICSYTHVME